MASREEYLTLLATLQNLQEVIISQTQANNDGMAAHISNECKTPFDSVIAAMESYRNSPGSMRMCPPNKTKIAQKTVQQNPQDLSKGDKVTIMLNYGPRAKSHALFGDFKVKYSKYRDEFLNPTSWIRFSRLAIGPGWMLLERKKLDELKRSLRKFNIPWQEIEYKDFSKDDEKSSAEESSDSEEEPPSEIKKKKKKKSKKVESSDSEEEPPSEIKKKKVKGDSGDKLSPNQYGNLQEKKFGIIFAKLPVGKKNRVVNVAIGNQDIDTPPSKKYKGLKTVKCLTDLQIEECEERAWTVLSEDMVNTLEENEKYENLATELRAILASADPDSSESESESESSDSD